MRYIIEFQASAQQQQIQDYLSELGAQVLKHWNHFDHTVLVDAVSEPPVTEIVESVINDQQSEMHLLEYPQELHFEGKLPFLDGDVALPKITFSTIEEQDWWKNFVLRTPDFENSEVTIHRRGANTNVYVLDSGITADHAEFAYVDIENVWTVTPDDYTDPHGHGTAIASVISGDQCGLSSANIKVVKIFRSDRGTYLSEFLDALDTIIAHGEDNQVNVINCSWSIAKNEYVEHKLRQLIDRNFLIVAAAGNNGTEIGDVTPASMHDVLAVGSYGPDLEPSDFSNYVGTSEIAYTEDSVNHGQVNTWAPGERIWAATRTGDYGYVAGTSISAAIASMLIACRLSGFVQSDGYLNPSYRDRPIKLPSGFSSDPHPTGLNTIFVSVTGKTNLLDLSDPKYSDATNSMISTTFKFNDSVLYHYGEYPSTIAFPTERSLTLLSEKRNVRPVINNWGLYTTKIELLAPLPEWCEIDISGVLVAYNPPSNTQDNEDLVDHYQIPMMIYSNNQDPVEYTVTLNVLPDVDSEQLIDISLLYSPGDNGCSTGATTPDCAGRLVDIGVVLACDDSCTSSQICCHFDAGAAPKGQQYECICGTLA